MSKVSELRKLDGEAPVLTDPDAGPALVAFDFDGTLTVRDSFMAFLRWHAGQPRFAQGLAKLTASAGAYLIHRDRGRLKAAAVREYLTGLTRDELESAAREFAAQTARKLLRPEAVATWKRWQAEEGSTLVIVTASPQLIVAPFARGLGADHLLGTELEFDTDDRLTGAILGENCRGEEKARRLRAQFGDDVRLTAAYGDTAGDVEMLAMADVKGFRVFRDRPAT